MHSEESWHYIAKEVKFELCDLGDKAAVLISVESDNLSMDYTGYELLSALPSYRFKNRKVYCYCTDNAAVVNSI